LPIRWPLHAARHCPAARWQPDAARPRLSACHPALLVLAHRSTGVQEEELNSLLGEVHPLEEELDLLLGTVDPLEEELDWLLGAVDSCGVELNSLHVDKRSHRLELKPWKAPPNGVFKEEEQLEARSGAEGNRFGVLPN
jgi:hypothetical protein